MDDYPLKNVFIWSWSVIAIATVISFDSSAYAHGGDETKRMHKAKSVEELRVKPNHVRLLSTTELEKTLGTNKPPEDIAIVRCTLNAHAPCRGVKLALLDSQSTLVSEVNSGADGMIGLEGLLPGEKYTISIRSERYAGQAEIGSGNYWNLNGDRIEQCARESLLNEK